MDLRRNLPRLLALVALVAAFIVVVIVVTTSLPDSDDGNGDRPRQQRAQEDEEEGSGDKYYFVQPGDSLSAIAEEEGIELERLEQLNPELDPQALSTGQRVRLR